MIAIIKNQLKRIFSFPSRIFQILIAPLLITVAMTSFYNTTAQNTSQSLRYLDLDNSLVSEDIVDKLGEDYLLEELDNIKEAEDIVKDRLDSVVLVIPEGFGQSIVSGEDDTIKLLALSENEATAGLSVAVNSYVDILSNLVGIDQITNQEDLVERASRFNEDSVFDYDRHGAYDKDQGAPLGIGSAMMMMMYNSMTIVKIINEDRKLKTLSRIRIAPVNKYGIIIGNLAVGLIIYVINAITMKVAFNILGVNMSMLSLSVMILISLITQLMQIFFTFGFSNSQQFTNMSGLIITILCMLGGCFWDLSMMSEGYIRVASITPQYWAMDIVHSFAKNGIVKYENFIALFGFLLLFFALASYGLKRLEDTEQYV